MTKLKEPLLGAKYTHKKGMPYQVLDVAVHSETQEKLVVYESLYENATGSIWVRPFDMFMDEGRFTLNEFQLFEYYHCHVYFLPSQEALAEEFRQNLLNSKIKNLLRVSSKISKPIGPHPLPMFEVDFKGTDYWTIVPMLSEFRGNLDMLIHPLSGNEWADHTTYAYFLGRRRTLNLEILKNL